MEAFKLASGLFVIPLMMAYAPLLLTGENGWGDVVFAAVLTLGLIVTIAMLSERYLFHVVTRPYIVAGLIAIVLLLVPATPVRVVGIALVLAITWLSYRVSRKHLIQHPTRGSG